MLKTIVITILISLSIIGGGVSVNKEELVGIGLKKPADYNFVVETEKIDILVKEDVIFTVFRDKSLGTNIKRSELVLNEDGLYTYKGMVCVATATVECLNSKYGGCKNYTFDRLPDNYHYFNYYDELKILFNGKEYNAIVVDSCGSCSTDKNENHQRVDILVSDSYKNIKSYGEIIYEKR